MANECFKSSVPRLAVVIGSVAGVNSDIMHVPHGRRKCRLNTAHYVSVGDAPLHAVDVGLIEVLQDGDGGVWCSST